MDIAGLVESILVSLQWDKWMFAIPGAKRLLKQEVAVVSHSHADHWAEDLSVKDLVLVPVGVRVPKRFIRMQNLMSVSGSVSLGKIKMFRISRRYLSGFLRYPIRHMHAFWWIARASGARILFVGDMSLCDVDTLGTFVGEAHRRGLLLHHVILPSFGGVTSHGAKDALELSRAIGKLARRLRSAYNIGLSALPHPINAEWADYNAMKLRSIVEDDGKIDMWKG